MHSARLRELAASIPIATKLLLAANIVIYIWMFLNNTGLQQYAISSYLVISKHEYFRLISSDFVHASFMHIFMNMSTLLQLGPNIEMGFGSALFLLITFWTVILSGLVYVSLGWCASYVYPSEYYTSGVGFSGVLFCYAIIESFHSTDSSRSIFGLFSVPAKLYPFVLLVLLQVLVPGISFLGHLSGLIIGLVILSGCLGPLLPSGDILSRAESHSCCGLQPIVRFPGYFPAGTRSIIYPLTSTMPNYCVSGGNCQCLVAALHIVWHAFCAILHIFNITAIFSVIGSWLYEKMLVVVSFFYRNNYEPVFTESIPVDI